MNYLAHAVLSFHNPAVLAGNMISDYVKGKKQYDLPGNVHTGIRLHRAIDDFTDQHVATKKMMAVFRPAYRLYSGAFVDIVYDYFLANDRDEFLNPETLLAFSLKTYQDLEQFSGVFPVGFARIFPHMSAQNWLYNYRLDEGIYKSFGGLVRRATYLSECDIAFSIFTSHKEYLHEQYRDFYPSVKNFAINTLHDLLKS